MKHQSIGTKLLVKLTLGIVLVMLLFGFFNVLYEIREVKSRLATKIDRTLQQLAIGLEDALWNLDRDQIDQIVASYLIDPDVVSIEVFDTATAATADAGTTAAGHGDTELRRVDVRRQNTDIGSVEVVFTSCAERFVDVSNNLPEGGIGGGEPGAGAGEPNRRIRRRHHHPRRRHPTAERRRDERHP